MRSSGTISAGSRNLFSADGGPHRRPHGPRTGASPTEMEGFPVLSVADGRVALLVSRGCGATIDARGIPLPYVYMFHSRSPHKTVIGDQRSADDGVEYVTADDGRWGSSYGAYPNQTVYRSNRGR